LDCGFENPTKGIDDLPVVFAENHFRQDLSDLTASSKIRLAHPPRRIGDADFDYVIGVCAPDVT
jgi:hypothetical protein